MFKVSHWAALAPLALALVACKDDEGGKGPEPPLVQTVIVGASEPATRRFTGIVRARTESALSFRVGGKVLERRVDPGQSVRRGQVLMRLDRADLALSLASARAAVEAARADSVRASAEERRRKRDGSKAGGQSVTDRITADARAAAARLAAARAQADLVANQLRYAELTADADGIVMEAMAEPGQVVAAGQPVIRLADEGAREAEIFIPEGQERQASAEASARLFADRDHAVPARRREMAASADPATRTFRARYVLDGAQAASLGSTVTLDLAEPLRGGEETLSVPLGALVDSGAGMRVWRLDPAGTRVTAQPVTIAGLGEESVRIASGLAKGDRIVALGAHLLKEGQRVRLAPERVASAVR